MKIAEVFAEEKYFKIFFSPYKRRRFEEFPNEEEETGADAGSGGFYAIDAWIDEMLDKYKNGCRS